MNPPTIRELMIFLGAFCIGLIIVALSEPRPEVIVRWPTPKNTGLVTYLDRASNCYQYSHQEVSCENGANPIPVQAGEGMENPLAKTEDSTSHKISLKDFFK